MDRRKNTKTFKNYSMCLVLILMCMRAGADSFTSTLPQPLLPQDILAMPFEMTFHITLPPGLLNVELGDGEYIANMYDENYHWSIQKTDVEHEPNGEGTSGGQASVNYGSGTGRRATIISSANGGDGVITEPGDYSITFTGSIKYTIGWRVDGVEMTSGPHEVELDPSPGGSLTMPFKLIAVKLLPLNPPFVRLNNDDDNANGIEDYTDQDSTDHDIRPLFQMGVVPSVIPDGTLELTYSSDNYNNGRIRIWMADANGVKTVVPSGTVWTVAEFQALPDKTLYVEGVQRSENENDAGVMLRYFWHNDLSGYRNDEALPALTVVGIDIMVDANYDGDFGIGDARFKRQSGRIVLLNDDNDNYCYLLPNNELGWNYAVDMGETTSVINENDLVPIKFSFYPSSLNHLVNLEISDNNKLTFWDSPTKGGNTYSLPLQFKPSGFISSQVPALPSQIWAEGISQGDTVLKLSLVDDGGIFDEVLFRVVRIGVLPDVNRDRKIDCYDRTNWVLRGPFRFWINDDEDSGNYNEGHLFATDDDTPGANSGWFEMDGRDPNYADSVVNGRRDLLDFFPIWLDVRELIKRIPPEIQLTYSLRHDDSALKIVFTKLEAGNAGDFLTKDTAACGPNLSENLYEAHVSTFTDGVLTLPSAFVEEIRTDNSNSNSNSNGSSNPNGNAKGVLLCEGCPTPVFTFSLSPLVFEAKAANGALIFARELPMKIHEVDAMYRRENLRNFTHPEHPQGVPINMPDNLLENKRIFFCMVIM